MLKTQVASLGVDHTVLLRLQRDMEERQCMIDGKNGHVERVYQRRGMVAGVYGCKVILDSGRVVYRDVNDVAVF